jgi:RNA polymerase sigma-70 factor (ECF subfamily)
VARDWFDAAAAEKRGSGKVITLPTERHAPAVSMDFENSISRRLIMEEVKAILARGQEGISSDRVSAIFRLYYQQGFTAKEIAAIPAFGLTAKGVESLLHRVVRQVRSELVEGPEAPKPL